MRARTTTLVFVLALLMVQVPVLAQVPTQAEPVFVARVIDGDTIRFLQAQREGREQGRGLWAREAGASEEVAQGSVSLSVDLNAELAVITNLSDEPIDMTGWVLVSVEGNQRFTFPSVTLAPGETVMVTSGRNAKDDPPRYLKWAGAYIWNNAGDPARLLDSTGSVVATAP